MLLPVETIHTDNGRIEWNIITYIKNAQRINYDPLIIVIILLSMTCEANGWGRIYLGLLMCVKPIFLRWDCFNVCVCLCV